MYLRTLNVFLFLGIFVLSSCSPKAASPTSAQAPLTDEAQVKLSYFSNTIHPILKNNCIYCHGHNGVSTPHSSNDAQEALASIETKGLINLINPSNSVFVNRMELSHNCGDVSNCQKIRGDFIAAIQKYAAAISSQEQNTDYAEKTKELIFSNGEVRVPQIFRGVLIVPASEVELGGRAIVVPEGNALTGQVWMAPNPPAHPSTAPRWIDTAEDNSATQAAPLDYKLYQMLHFYGQDGKDPFYTTQVCFSVLDKSVSDVTSTPFRYAKNTNFVDLGACFNSSTILPKNVISDRAAAVNLASYTEATLLSELNSSFPNLFSGPRYNKDYPFLNGVATNTTAYRVEASQQIHAVVSSLQIQNLFLPELRSVLYKADASLKDEFAFVRGLSDLQLDTVDHFRDRVRLSLGEIVQGNYNLKGVLKSDSTLQTVAINSVQPLTPSKYYVGKGFHANSPIEEFFEPNAEGLKPASGTFSFRVSEAGEYNIFYRAKVKESGQPRNLHLSTKLWSQANGEFIKNIGGKYASQLFSNAGNRTTLMWHDSGQAKYVLSPGEYRLHFHELNDGAQVDEIAIIKKDSNHSLTVSGRENQFNDYFFSSPKPRVLSFDLSAIFGEGYRFEVEVFNYSDQAYGFIRPRFILNGENIEVKNIGILVNGKKGASFDNTFSTIAGVVGSSDPLNYTVMTVLKDKGLELDNFSFVFETLKLTYDPATEFRPEGPEAAQKIKCKELALFEKTVAPIYNEMRVMRTSDYDQYFGSAVKIDSRAPSTYTCTSCHGVNHPTFNMRLEPEEFCGEALLRIDNWKQPQFSKILRGINVSFGHDPAVGALGDLYVLEDAILNSSQTDYVRDSNAKIVKSMKGQFESYPMSSTIMGTRPIRNLFGEILGVDGEPLMYEEERNMNGIRTGIISYLNPYDAAFEDVPLLQYKGDEIYKQKWPQVYTRSSFNNSFPIVSDVLSVGELTYGTLKQPIAGFLIEPVNFCNRIPNTNRFAYDANEFATERVALESYCSQLLAHQNSYKPVMEALLTKYRDIVVNWINRECVARYPAVNGVPDSRCAP